ncbi:MAG TPA: rhomboid family intramembrane serine protease [Candidatus Limnocylindria bacterium]|nr:rhomboid family intramembrane serine protease [Candidatus Limnocylindria bacterium]
MIPLRDASPVRGIPIVNRLLLAVNLAAWIYVVYLTRQPGALDAFFDRYSFDWLEFTRRIVSGDLGLDTFAPLVTHMFLHGGWLHLIGNVLYLWIFGDNVEDRFGSVQYLIFYLLCGIVAAIGQGLIAPGPMVGASGAIAGVLGAYLLLSPTARISTLVFLGFFITIVELPALIVIGMFIVLQILEGVAELRVAGHAAAQQVAYFAHISGFVAGLVLLVFFRRGDGERRARFG